MELYQLHRPQGQAVPIVANLPHSGLFVPEEIAAQMLPEHLRSLPNSDWHLDRLYAFLPSLGITVLQATHSRYVVDLNRAAKEPLFGSFWSSVVPETTAFGQPIYHTRPSPDSIQRRLCKAKNCIPPRLSMIRAIQTNKLTDDTDFAVLAASDWFLVRSHVAPVRESTSG